MTCIIHYCLCLLLLLTLLSIQLQDVHGQDRETLTRICDTYNAQNLSLRIGVLDKGQSGQDAQLPDINHEMWNRTKSNKFEAIPLFLSRHGIFGHVATAFLTRFGCKTQMTLYSFASLFANIDAGKMDFVFSNPMHAAELKVLHQAKPLVSLVMQYTSPTNGRLPFPGAQAYLDRFGSIMMYAGINMTKPQGIIPGWLQTRRALINSFHPQTFQDVVAMIPQFPKKNLTMCAVSPTSFGGLQMIAYEFMKLGVVMSQAFTINYGGSHNACIDQVLKGLADFTNIRTGQIEVYINDTRIDPGTFTVINDSPTLYFPLHISTPFYPEWPVLALPSVPSPLQQAFTVPLTSLAVVTNTPEALAVSGASFAYPFPYDTVETLMFDLDILATGQCDVGWARSMPGDTIPLDPTVPHPCFPCLPGTHVVIRNDTSICTPCPYNTYSINVTVNCTPCTHGYVTSVIGATSEDFCHEPDHPIQGISSSSSTGMVALCAVSMSVLFATAIGVVILRRNPVMKAASPWFLVLVLSGLALLCSSIIPRAMENVGTNDSNRVNIPSPITCNAEIWLSNLGYTLVTSSLFVKTWRVWSIFTSRQLAGRKPLSDRRLSIIVGLGLVFQACLILGLTQSYPMQMAIHSLNSQYDYLSCSLDPDSQYTLQSLYLPAIMIPRFVLLIATTIAAFLVRGLPAAFNESSQLLYTMYNLSFFSVLLPAIDVAVGRGKDTGLIAYSVSLAIICLLTALILFAPKFLLIARGQVRAQAHGAQASKWSSNSGSSRPTNTPFATSTGMPMVKKSNSKGGDVTATMGGRNSKQDTTMQTSSHVIQHRPHQEEPPKMPLVSLPGAIPDKDDKEVDVKEGSILNHQPEMSQSSIKHSTTLRGKEDPTTNLRYGANTPTQTRTSVYRVSLHTQPTYPHPRPHSHGAVIGASGAETPERAHSPPNQTFRSPSAGAGSGAVGAASVASPPTFHRTISSVSLVSPISAVRIPQDIPPFTPIPVFRESVGTPTESVVDATKTNHETDSPITPMGVEQPIIRTHLSSSTASSEQD